MATSFSMAQPAVLDLLAQAIDHYHPDLRDADVRIMVLMANNNDGPALVRGGYPALGLMKVLGPKDRIACKCEAQLLIDALDYTDLEAEGKLAFLDHEAMHLELRSLPEKSLARAKSQHVLDCEQADKKGKPHPILKWWKQDGRMRPFLKARKGDWNAGDGFKSVCERHGHNAIEFRNLRECFKLASEFADKGLLERGHKAIEGMARANA